MQREGKLWYAEGEGGDVENSLCRRIAMENGKDKESIREINIQREEGKELWQNRAPGTNHRMFGLLGRCERAW